jgi:hypothetical protein
VVKAESAQQIKNIMGLCSIRYYIGVTEQSPIDLDQLAAMADEVKERFE